MSLRLPESVHVAKKKAAKRKGVSVKPRVVKSARREAGRPFDVEGEKADRCLEGVIRNIATHRNAKRCRERGRELGGFQMWVRRSEEEVEQGRLLSEARSRAIGTPLVSALVLAVVSTSLYALGFRACYPTAVVAGREGAWNPLPLAVAALMVFVVSLFFFRRRQMATGQSELALQKGTICDQCHEPSFAKVGESCNCGGVFEPMEHWEWLDDSSDGDTD